VPCHPGAAGHAVWMDLRVYPDPGDRGGSPSGFRWGNRLIYDAPDMFGNE